MTRRVKGATGVGPGVAARGNPNVARSGPDQEENDG